MDWMSNKSDILQRGSIQSLYFQRQELCYHGCYIHQDGRHLMDMVMKYLPLLPIVDMKTKNKWRSVQVLYTSVSLFGS